MRLSTILLALLPTVVISLGADPYAGIYDTVAIPSMTNGIDLYSYYLDTKTMRAGLKSSRPAWNHSLDPVGTTYTSLTALQTAIGGPLVDTPTQYSHTTYLISQTVTRRSPNTASPITDSVGNHFKVGPPNQVGTLLTWYGRYRRPAAAHDCRLAHLQPHVDPHGTHDQRYHGLLPVKASWYLKGTNTCKLPHNHALLFLIAAKAATINIPKWVSADSSKQPRWWDKEGDAWVRSLAERLEIEYGSLPNYPSADDVSRLTKMIPESEHSNLVLSVLSLCLLPHTPAADGVASSAKAPAAAPLFYTAAERAFLARTLDLLGVARAHLLSAEDHVAQGLYHELKTAEVNRQKAEAARKSQEEGWGGYWGRVAATSVGVILGGVAIGLTSGLAAPALLPLLPFLSAEAAPVVLGTLFGLTGGGLAGKRVNKRWAGVDVFEFVQVTGGGEGADPTAIVNKGKGEVPGSEVEKAQAPSLVATIIIPGILLKSESEGIDSVKRCSSLFTSPRRDTFVLSHSPSTMLSTGKALHSWVTNELLGRLKGEIIKRTALQAVMGAVALPMTIYKTTGTVVDNEWIRGTDRARKAGRLLAEVLKDKVQGERPIVLVGSSLGALVLFEAVLTLASSTPPLPAPLIDSAIFISLPTAPPPSEWSKVRNAVGRRVVNAWCKTDLVLAGVGRLHEVLGEGRVSTMAGLGPVQDVPGVENVDLGGVVKGHFELNEKMEKVLETVRANE